MHPLLQAFARQIEAMSLGPGWRTSAPPQRLTIELLRFRGGGSKLFTNAVFAAGTRVDADPAFARRTVRKGADLFTREREEVLVLAEDARVVVEHSITGEPISPEDAQRSLAEVPELGVFAGLAHGDAMLKQWGLGFDGERRLGLVSIHRDLERGELDEQHLREAGFREVEEGLWATPARKLSLVWMGGTVYGYLGPINNVSMGSWFSDGSSDAIDPEEEYVEDLDDDDDDDE